MFNIKRIREAISEWIRPKESPDLTTGIKFEGSIKDKISTSKKEESLKKDTYFIYLSRVFNERLMVYEYLFLDERKVLIRHAQDYEGDIQNQVLDFYKCLSEEFFKNNNVYIKLVKY